MTRTGLPAGGPAPQTDAPDVDQQTPDESAAARSAFLVNISHEIRASLDGILGITTLLQKTRLDVEQSDYVQSIKLSVDAMLSVISDILDFSKVEAGKIKLEPIRFDLHDVVESTVDLIATGAHEKGLEVAVMIDDTVPQQVIGDPTRLRQVLLNLGTNAVNFTEAGEIVFIVKKQAAPPDSRADEVMLEFEISDTGMGLPEKKREAIFLPFTQADASITRKPGGTGLGLAISRHLVNLMGGAITVESAEGKGATFRFTCRVALAGPAAASSPPPADGVKGMRCLVVTDNPTSHKVLDWYIHRWGGICKHCDSREDAVQWLSARALPFDLVIADFGHGNSHKYKSLATAIREEANAATIPLLCLIAKNRTDDTAFLQNYGYYAYLTKPIRQVHLYNALTIIRHKPAATSPADTPVPAAAVNGAKSRAHVLVVDDNPVNRKVLVAMLNRQNIRCDVVEDGEQALAACAQNHYDLIFMDCLMPVMDGYEATRRIREILADVPIVAITADVLPESRDRCLAAGMNDYISKPFNMQSLFDAANKYLKAKP